MILEGAMIIIACLSLTAFHPGFAFQGAWSNANFTLRRNTNKNAKESGLEDGVLAKTEADVQTQQISPTMS